MNTIRIVVPILLPYDYLECNCGYEGTLTVLLDMAYSDVGDDKIVDPKCRYEGWLMAVVPSEV